MAAIRRVNNRFLSWLVGTMVVLGVAVYAVHGYQVQRHAGIFKHRAEQAQEQGHFDEAAKYYHLYLGYAPDDNEARSAYGRVLDKKGNKSGRDLYKLFMVFEEVLRREPQRHDIRRRLAEVAMTPPLRRFKDASEHLDVLLKGAYKEDGELEQKLAWCTDAKGDSAKAERLYETALAHNPHHLLSYTQLASLRLRLKKTREADKVMEQLVKANNDNYQAHLARAVYLRQRGLTADIAKEVGQAVQLAPEEADTILSAADLALSLDHFEEARTLLQRGIELHPANADLYRLLARVEERAKRLDEAIAWLRRGMKAAPKQAQNSLLYPLAKLLIQHGDLAQAEEAIERLRTGKAAEVVVRELKALVLISHEKWSEGARVLEGVRALLVGQPEQSAQVNLWLGRCYERLGEADRALGSYRQTLALNPRLVSARIGIASTLVALGKLDEALGAYQAVLKDEPSVGPSVAQLLILRNLGQEPAKRNWKEVDETLDQAAKALPKSTEVPLLRAESLVARNQPEQAQVILDTARKEQPERVELWLASANLADLRGQPEKALEILNQAEQGLGDRVELRVARARCWIQRGDKGAQEAPAALAKLEQDTGKFKSADETRLLRGLAEAYSRAGKIGEAERLWTQLAQKMPADLAARLALFDLALQTGDDKAIRRLTEEIRTVEGADGTLWRYGQACYNLASARKGNKEALKEARALLAEIASRRPTWAAVVFRQAELEDLEGNQQEAMQRYEQALDLGERNPLALRRAVQLMYARNLQARADRLMAKVQKQAPLPPELMRLQSQLLSQRGDHADAIALARKPVEAGSKDLTDYVWLGSILSAAGKGKEKEAEDILRKALQLPGADQIAEPWVVLVQVLAKTNQKDKALAVIDEARGKLPAELATLALAQCYEAIGEQAKAAEEFDAALKKKPDDLVVLRNLASFHMRLGQPQKAEPQLRKILDPQTKATADDVAWARRSLALGLSSTGMYQPFLEALQVIEENIKVTGGSPEDLRTKAVILSGRSERRREALRTLESLQGRQLCTDEEQLLLAELYEAIHDWPNSRKAYLRLASTSANPPLVARCALAFLRHHEVEDAGAALQKLETLEPDSIATLEVRVLLLKEQGKADEAAALLTTYADKPDARPDLAAALLEQIGKPAAAERIYRQLAQSQLPDRLLLLATFLGRQGRSEETLDLCERAGQTGSGEMAVNAAMSVLHAAKPPSEQHCRRIGRLLDEAIKKKPTSLALQFHSADLHSLQGNYAEAEAVYRRILEQDQRNAVALNNLAWLVALDNGKTHEALELIDRAIELFGPAAEFLDTRAVVYLVSSEPKKAVDDLEAAISDAPTATMYFHLAHAQSLANKRAEAVASIRKAREDLKLTKNDLHPLEQKTFAQLVEDLRER